MVTTDLLAESQELNRHAEAPLLMGRLLCTKLLEQQSSEILPYAYYKKTHYLCNIIGHPPGTLFFFVQQFPHGFRTTEKRISGRARGATHFFSLPTRLHISVCYNLVRGDPGPMNAVRVSRAGADSLACDYACTELSSDVRARAREHNNILKHYRR